jgi:type IV pilus assembly protein PilV
MEIRKQGGFTLIEVMTSVLVLAIGVIGAAGMQLGALRTAQQSAFQTLALQFASELADKIRATTQEMPSGSLSPFLDLEYASATDAVPVPDMLCYSRNCNSEALTKFELYEWKTRIRTRLPGARVKICRDAMPWSQAAAGFTWQCTTPAEGAAAAPLVIKLGWKSKDAHPNGRAKKETDTNFPPSVAITVASYQK